MTTYTLTIEGMSCAHCSAAVKSALEKVRGVISAEVDLSAKTAVVQAKKSALGSALSNAVTKAGYEVIGVEG